MKYNPATSPAAGKNPSAEGFVNVSLAEYNQHMYDPLRIGL